MSTNVRVFLSHSHDDKAVADAVAGLLRGVFGDAIHLRYSSADDNGEGITPGAPWLDWILEQVSQADITFILLTPQSWHKPWVIWESGAVAGAGLVSGERTSVVPIAFKISMEQVPSPLRSLQAIFGNDKSAVRRLLDKLRSKYDEGAIMDDDFYEFKINQHINSYITLIDEALKDRPMDLTEGAVVDWIARIDAFAAENRASEIDHLRRALEIAFTPIGTDASNTPLDARLHRRLGEMYLRAKKSNQAVRQSDLALKAASPRDIFLLHKKAMAQLEAMDLPGAEETLNLIEELDPFASAENPEIGGLQGRVYRTKWEANGNIEDLRKARDENATVAKCNPDSYWMHDTVGQYSLLLGETECAKESFNAALLVLEHLNEDNVWVRATRATCLLGLGLDDEGMGALQAVAEMTLSPQEKKSIARGLVRIAQGRRLEDAALEGWKTIIGL